MRVLRKLSGRIDPRLKVLWVLSSMVSWWTRDWMVLACALVINSAIAYLLGGGSRYAARTRYLLGVVLVIGAFALFAGGGLSGLIHSILPVGRLTVMAMAAIAFYALTSPQEILEGLAGLKTPRFICYSLGVGFRFLPVIPDECARIVTAQRARGMYARRGIGVILGLSVMLRALFVPLVTGMLRRIMVFQIAVQMRGLDKSGVVVRNPAFSLANIAVLAYIIAYVTLSIILPSRDWSLQGS